MCTGAEFIYEVTTLGRGEKLYKCQSTEIIDFSGSFHNGSVANQNWNDSLYFFIKKEAAIDSYGHTFDETRRVYTSNYIIECTLNIPLQIVFTDDPTFKTGCRPIKDIIIYTEKAIEKKYPKKPSKYNLHYQEPDTEYRFMYILGQKGFAFSCFENTDEDIEVIIPEPILHNPTLFTQQCLGKTPEKKI